jgi:hypothetical protein
MPNQPPTRSVKISDDERGGWSSDRPREGGRVRPADISVRCQVLTPSDRIRYSPGSLLLVVSGSVAERERFVDRVIEERGIVFSLERVRKLLAGRVPAEELEDRATELLDAAILKRLQASETVVLALDGLDPEERERYLRMAAPLKRPRHLILLETSRDQVADEDRAPLNDLRRALDAGQLGAEGFHTALRLGGGATSELKRVIFAPAPVED